MNYVNYSKRVREYNPSNLVALDCYCRDRGINYYVVTDNPTRFEFDPTAKHVFINYPEKSVTLPLDANVPAEEVLEFLSYVAVKYDARETIAHLHRQQRQAGLDI